MTITGKVIDDITNQPVPRATVALLSGNINLVSGAADDNGNFSLSTQQTPDSLLITSVGYKGIYWPLPQYSTASVFQLPISTDPLDTVVIEYKPKTKIPWWILVIAGIVILKNNKLL